MVFYLPSVRRSVFLLMRNVRKRVCVLASVCMCTQDPEYAYSQPRQGVVPGTAKQTRQPAENEVLQDYMYRYGFLPAGSFR